MSSAILYLAIVAIWACVLIPRWLKRDSARSVTAPVPAPVPVGSKVRVGATLAGVEDVSGGAQVALAVTFETEGGEKPVCVADSVVRIFGGDAQ